MKKNILNVKDLFAQVVSLELTTFDGEPTGVTLSVVGHDSRQYKDLEKRLLPYYLGKPLTPQGSINLMSLSPEEISQVNELKLQMTLACIVGWDAEVFGQPYSPEATTELFGKPEATFIVEQVEAFVSERANFFQRSKK